MSVPTASRAAHAAFTSHTGKRTREHRTLLAPPLDAFEGERGEAGLEPLLSLIADVVDMDLVLVGHVNAHEYTAVATFSRNPELTFDKGGVIPIEKTYCREEITAAAPFAIGDATADPAFRDHPGWTELGLRSYVGVPIVLEDGTLFGTVCGTDTQPKDVPPEAAERLLLLAGTLSAEISRRLGLKAASEAERGLARASRTLQEHVTRLARGQAQRDARIRSLHGSLMRANRAQADAIRRLEAANRELEEFTYTVSHDLSEPLRGIETLTGILEAEAATGCREELAEVAKLTRQNAAEMKDRVKRVLELSRVMRADFEEEDVELRAVTESVLKHLDTTIREAGARVVVQDDPPLPRVRGQRVRLEQVYTNLVENAVKYNRDRAVRVLIGWEERGSERVHFVRDDGVGIPEQWRERVLGAFRRGPNAADARGTGVGLAIVTKVVQRHKGRAWLEETPGGGATFCFTLGEETGTGQAAQTG